MPYDPYADPSDPSGNYTSGFNQYQASQNSLAPPAAQGNTPSGSSRPTTNPVPSVPHNTMNSTTDAARTADVYDPSNPIRALRNALENRGLNTTSNNPMIRYLMGMAPALSNLFMLKGVSGQQGDGGSLMSGGLGGEFAKFLDKALGSSGASSGMGTAPVANLQPFMSQNLGGGGLQNILSQAMSSYHNWEGDSNRAANPWMDQFQSAIGTNGMPSSMIGSLMTPFLGSYGRAYSNQLTAMEDRAHDDPAIYNDPNNNDIFSYLVRHMR